MVIQHDNGAIGYMLLTQAREVLPQGGLGEVIQVEVERGAEWPGLAAARQSRGVRQPGRLLMLMLLRFL